MNGSLVTKVRLHGRSTVTSGRRAGVFATALVVSLLSGCGGGDAGPKREAISGTVTREGIPVDDGLIMFKPHGNGPATEVAIKDGKYQFDKENGPVAGMHDIRIRQSAPRAPVPEGTPLKDAEILPET
ncbi:MAG: hypothetical protein KF861_02790, partial [Planctomycetaceae bacterium]|nr:hypothetical protein [Planctomycetaceae bacterium]